MIHFKNVTKQYIQGEKTLKVLDNFNFLLEDKGIVAIVGKSGSGKSTFLSLLGGLDQVDRGSISINGSLISSMSEVELTKYRAKNIGIIFQNFQLIEHFTALENILLPLEILEVTDAREKALWALDIVGLKDRAEHFPRQLSGGEKQRIAIARAYVTKPSIILADEPSGNLDPETGEQVMDILFATAKKLEQTVILVTHDSELAKKCDHIYEIKNHQVMKVL